MSRKAELARSAPTVAANPKNTRPLPADERPGSLNLLIQAVKVALSITNRYLTSPFVIRS